jgi:hypothetical protein
MRKRLLLLFGLLAILVGIGVLRLTAPKPGLFEETGFRLRAGMSVREVEALFNSPGWIGFEASGLASGIWRDKGGPMVVAYFDKNGLLTDAYMGNPNEESLRDLHLNETFFERLRRWIHL